MMTLTEYIDYVGVTIKQNRAVQTPAFDSFNFRETPPRSAESMQVSNATKKKLCNTQVNVS